VLNKIHPLLKFREELNLNCRNLTMNKMGMNRLMMMKIHFTMVFILKMWLRKLMKSSN